MPEWLDRQTERVFASTRMSAFENHFEPGYAYPGIRAAGRVRFDRPGQPIGRGLPHPTPGPGQRDKTLTLVIRLPSGTDPKLAFNDSG